MLLRLSCIDQRVSTDRVLQLLGDLVLLALKDN